MRLESQGVELSFENRSSNGIDVSSDCTKHLGLCVIQGALGGLWSGLLDKESSDEWIRAASEPPPEIRLSHQ